MDKEKVIQFKNNIASTNKILLSNQEISFDLIDQYFLTVVLMAIAIAEENDSTNNYSNNVPYWDVSENLNKHRSIRECDEHIQKIIVWLKTIFTYNCSVFSCSRNGYCRAKIECETRNIVFFVIHSYNENSKYLKPFFEMNENSQEPKFMFLKYDYDNKNGKINRIVLNIPNVTGEIEKEIDLTKSYEAIKLHINNFIEESTYLTEAKKHLESGVINSQLDNKEEK